VTRYVLHGYELHSDLVLKLPTAVESLGHPVLTAARGRDVEVPHVSPPGDLIAQFADRSRRVHYTFARTRERVTLRFHGAADVVGDPELQQLEVRLHPGTDSDLTSVLLVGATMATKLLVDGHLVLHASAVVIDEQVMAFVGSSNMGKSTLAALGFRQGFEVISDDVLRVDFSERNGVAVWPGAGEVRLREKARHLAAPRTPNPGVASSRQTADGRTAMRTASTRTSPLPLGSVVVPLPERGGSSVRVTRLDAFSALRRLMSFPRVLGLVDSSIAGRQFTQLAEMCDRVPVFEARLPWGPPFDDDLVSEVHDQAVRLVRGF
jgi:hypothetical protein